MTIFRVLGPLEVVCDGRVVELGGGRPRTLLVALLVHANEPLSAARLGELLWEEPPASAAKIVQNCVVRLRRLLPEGTLVTRPRGYELRLDAGCLDAEAFDTLVERARARLGAADPAAALELYGQALALWRGPPLGDVDEAPFTAAFVRRLDDLHDEALLGRADALLRLGRQAEALPLLQQALADDPLHEPAGALLMLALYRCGRQGDALALYRGLRRRLVEELGVEPGPALRQMEQRILQQDAELEPPPQAPAAGGRASRRRLAAAILAAATAAGLALILLLGPLRGSNAAPEGIPPNSVAVVDEATARLERDLPVGAAPMAVLPVGGDVWVANQLDGTLMAIDAQTVQVKPPTIAISSNLLGGVTSLAVSRHALWIADSAVADVVRLTLPAPGLLDHIRLPSENDYVTLSAGPSDVWVTSAHLRALLDIAAGSGRVRARIALPGSPIASVVTAGAVWCVVARGDAGSLVRIDPATDAVTTRVDLPGAPTAVAGGRGMVWVAVAPRDTVFEVDPRTDSVVRTFAAPGSPIALAADRSGVWVAAAKTQTLLRLDPERGAITARLRLRGTPHALALAAGRVWVAGA